MVSVAPLTKIPLSREQFFYYLFNKTIPSGSLVEVSLGKRKINGIVLDSKNDFTRSGNYRMKKIEKIIEENFLTENQIKLAKFISEHYFSSLGIVLKSFVPARIKERIRNQESGIKNWESRIGRENKSDKKSTRRVEKNYKAHVEKINLFVIREFFFRKD